MIIVVAFFIINIVPKSQFDNTNVWLKEQNNGIPLVMAHAGGAGVNPGNTMRAFEHSFEIGVDVLEMDLQMTKDKVLVLRHGENKTGNIRSKSNCDTVIWDETYEWLYENCNFGYNYKDAEDNYIYKELTKEEWIAEKIYLTTLEEVFETFKDNVLYNIEVKADADAWRTETVDELYKLIDRYDLSNHVLVAVAFGDISEYITNTYPNLYLSTSQPEAQDFIIKTYSFTNLFYQPKGYSGLQIPTSFGLPVINKLQLDNKRVVNSAHSQNMAVHYWTINDEDEMKRPSELGCDGIITNYPELLIKIIEDIYA